MISLNIIPHDKHKATLYLSELVMGTGALNQEYRENVVIKNGIKVYWRESIGVYSNLWIRERSMEDTVMWSAFVTQVKQSGKT